MQSAKSSYRKGTGIFNTIPCLSHLKNVAQIQNKMSYKTLNTIFRTKQSVQAQSGG